MLKLCSSVIMLLAGVAHGDYGDQFREPNDNIPIPTTCRLSLAGLGAEVPVLCRPAKFGDKSTLVTDSQRPNKVFMDRTRPMMLAEELDACDRTKLCIGDACMGKVVVVQRGACSFYQKALNIMYASDGNAAAIIIFDSQESGNGWPLTMTRGDEPKAETEKFASMPVVSMMKDSGDAVIKMMQKNPNAEAKFGLNMPGGGGWEHLENRFAILKQLQNPENHKRAELFHNLGAAISSSTMKEHHLAIDAAEASAHLQESKATLALLKELYDREYKYAGKAHTACRLAKYAKDANEVRTLLDQAQDDIQGTDYGNVFPPTSSRHICEIFDLYMKERSENSFTDTFNMFLHSKMNPDGGTSGKAVALDPSGSTDEARKFWGGDSKKYTESRLEGFSPLQID